MRGIFPFCIVVLLTLTGCVHEPMVQFNAGTGDAGSTMLQQSISSGAEVVTTNALPAINGPWFYYENEQGTQYLLAAEDWENFVQWLHQAFGPLRVGSKESIGSIPKDSWGRYPFPLKHGGLEFRYNSHGSHIGPQVLIVRPRNQNERSRREMDMMIRRSQSRWRNP